MRACGSSLAKIREIQKEFDKAFKELFGGGRGTLELAEDEDILEAGIGSFPSRQEKTSEYDAAFRWRKSTDSHCTFFAIQNLKPSPFCLLDEIEAALDDSM